MQTSIEARNYRLISAISENNERIFFNQNPTSPLNARILQHRLIADENSRLIIYTPPSEETRTLYISNRAFSILAELRSGQWVTIKSLKDSKHETRKVIADLRCFGLIIETSPRLKAYRLRGQVNLYPTGINSPASILSFLPSIDESKEIEKAKAQLEIARRFGRINKHFDFLRAMEA